MKRSYNSTTRDAPKYINYTKRNASKRHSSSSSSSDSLLLSNQDEIIWQVTANKYSKFERVEIPVSVNEDRIVVWTDGACSRNGQDGASAGIGVFFGVDDRKNVAEKLEGIQTNNRAEMMAALRAMEILKSEYGVERSAKIHTDSDYLYQGMIGRVKKWKREKRFQKMKNQDMWNLLIAANDEFRDLEWSKIKGHSDDFGNNNADRLAREGAKL